MKTMKKAKSLKGFTLVELIVVMVILAILVALMVPSLTKYIDKANDQSILVEARYCLTALQTFASEEYGTSKHIDAALKGDIDADLNSTPKDNSEIYQMAECPGTISDVLVERSRISGFTYTNGDRKISWTKAGGFGDVTDA